MYKETIISIVIVIFVLISNSVSEKYTDKALGKTNENLYKLREQIERALEEDSGINKKNIEKTVQQILEEWDKEYYILAIYLEHDELEKIKKELIILKANIELNRYKDAVTDIDRGLFSIEHLKEKEVLNIDNFF